MKKAQTATEYLIVLAIVVIMALIVVGVMGGFAGIGSGAKSRASATYWNTADMAIPQFTAFSASDNLNISIRNNLKDNITLGTVRIGGGLQTCSPTTLAAGQTAICSDADGAIGCSAEGASFIYDVSVSYTVDATGASYAFTGEGKKREGKCAT